ncbi:hypothetical protein [Actinomadura sp. HBU206391]
MPFDRLRREAVGAAKLREVAMTAGPGEPDDALGGEVAVSGVRDDA